MAKENGQAINQHKAMAMGKMGQESAPKGKPSAGFKKGGAVKRSK